jgi:hypothetical protein
MSNLNLSVAVGDYDRNRPLFSGAVRIDGVDLGVHDAVARFPHGSATPVRAKPVRSEENPRSVAANLASQPCIR